MYDQQIRSEFVQERAAQLRLDWPSAPPRNRVRLALGHGLIRAGRRLACEPSPRLSLRA